MTSKNIIFTLDFWVELPQILGTGKIFCVLAILRPGNSLTHFVTSNAGKGLKITFNNVLCRQCFLAGLPHPASESL